MAQGNDQLSLFDSHCHLNFSDFDNDRIPVLNQAKKAEVSHICIPATKHAEWPSLINESELLSKVGPVNIVTALGLHPWFIAEHNLEHLKVLDRLLQQRPARVVAIGETGLDFFDRNMTSHAKVKQLALFTGQVELACLHQMPLIIHGRKSHDDILKVLRRCKPKRAGIIHAFSGSEQQAGEYLKLGFKLGFGGGITYPRASKTRHLASMLPINSIVLETDAPDMPLNGYQGQRNEPGRVKLVAECLARLRGISFREVAEATSHNCRTLFRI
ncbi:TatD family hydrolase [Endozoicomonas sp. SESOKO1]|uniref:TatD family hydrolase n=1 Tax=Endozoicomonas sp. SESOKO1 TaxID=2828742 RepID=UPI00214890BA